jgi:hypothetical protein
LRFKWLGWLATVKWTCLSVARLCRVSDGGVVGDRLECWGWCISAGRFSQHRGFHTSEVLGLGFLGCRQRDFVSLSLEARVSWESSRVERLRQALANGGSCSLRGWASSVSGVDLLGAIILLIHSFEFKCFVLELFK